MIGQSIQPISTHLGHPIDQNRPHPRLNLRVKLRESVTIPRVVRLLVAHDIPHVLRRAPHGVRETRRVAWCRVLTTHLHAEVRIADTVLIVVQHGRRLLSIDVRTIDHRQRLLQLSQMSINLVYCIPMTHAFLLCGILVQIRMWRHAVHHAVIALQLCLHVRRRSLRRRLLRSR